jgi:hypothetical protein
LPVAEERADGLAQRHAEHLLHDLGRGVEAVVRAEVEPVREPGDLLLLALLLREDLLGLAVGHVVGEDHVLAVRVLVVRDLVTGDLALLRQREELLDLLEQLAVRGDFVQELPHLLARGHLLLLSS